MVAVIAVGALAVIAFIYVVKKVAATNSVVKADATEFDNAVKTEVATLKSDVLNEVKKL